MEITMQDLEMLSRIYNTLLTVSTKGDDTVIMGDCLKAFRSYILDKKEKIENVQGE